MLSYATIRSWCTQKIGSLQEHTATKSCHSALKQWRNVLKIGQQDVYRETRGNDGSIYGWYDGQVFDCQQPSRSLERVLPHIERVWYETEFKKVYFWRYVRRFPRLHRRSKKDQNQYKANLCDSQPPKSEEQL